MGIETLSSNRTMEMKFEESEDADNEDDEDEDEEPTLSEEAMKLLSRHSTSSNLFSPSTKSSSVASPKCPASSKIIGHHQGGGHFPGAYGGIPEDREHAEEEEGDTIIDKMAAWEGAAW
eukprot:TRINITY_DN7979_c0_g1_i1.p1 TRINITY_DN7979_c0_g1~~TRINITY_DN7979_c0_g1_i1.p1  ORF type:complete len:127 (-),score=47.70 TRINITY_DN7979_c0_g1_i1:124-480(-)